MTTTVAANHLATADPQPRLTLPPPDRDRHGIARGRAVEGQACPSKPGQFGGACPPLRCRASPGPHRHWQIAQRQPDRGLPGLARRVQ